MHRVIYIIIVLLLVLTILKCDHFKKYDQHRSNGIPISKGLAIINDSEFKRQSNIYKNLKTSRDQVIAWEWDCGGFNNIRMQFEIMFGLSVIYNRTLVLPPKQKWYLMPDDEPCQIEDFYNIDILKVVFPVITSDEWFSRKVSYQEYIEYFGVQNKFTETNRVNASKTRWEILDNYVRENNLIEKDVWFFKSCYDNYAHRMFGNLDDYFRESDHLNEIRDRICKGFKFKSEITDLLQTMLRKNAITELGQYNSVHFRRGDFSISHPHQIKVNIELYRDVLLKRFDTHIPLLIITNEKDKSVFKPIADVFDFVFYLDMSIVPENRKKWTALIDSLGGILSYRFVGTAESTFSYYIQILRGYISYYYPEYVSDSLYFLQEERGRQIAKITDEWNCDMGCWAFNDQDRWRYRIKVNNEQRQKEKILR